MQDGRCGMNGLTMLMHVESMMNIKSATDNHNRLD